MAGPSHASWLIDNPSVASASAKTAAAAGDAAASALPMPTDCEPWPGKTKADEVIVAERSGRNGPHEWRRVRRCTETERSGYSRGHERATFIDPSGRAAAARPGHRQAVRGRPLGNRARGRDANLERAPDRGARRDGPRAVARAR